MPQTMRAVLASCLLFLLGLALLGTLAFSPVQADDSVPKPTIHPAKGEMCVEPTPLMRRNHMELLEHQRDEVVINGVRQRLHSLEECIACHAQTDASGAQIPINAEGQFCETCHRYAAVRIDCFECHAAVNTND